MDNKDFSNEVRPGAALAEMAGGNHRIGTEGASSSDPSRFKMWRTTKSAIVSLYQPNHIPLEKRVTNTLFAVLLMVYGAHGIWIDDLYLPAKHGKGLHLHDSPAWTMYGAFICASLVMLSVVVDHYDRRDNEAVYNRFANFFQVIGWSLAILSFILMLAK